MMNLKTEKKLKENILKLSAKAIESTVKQPITFFVNFNRILKHKR
jgi:hypothetical protein